MSQETSEKVTRTINDKHHKLQNDVANLVTTFVNKNDDAKKRQAEQCLSSSQTLLELLAHPDQPSWLKDLNTQLKKYTADAIKPEAVMRTVIEINKALLAYQFDPKASTTKRINFESTFRQYFDNSKLPELFDEIIQLLNQIRDSGEIDSNSMLSALEELVASLKTGKSGSWLSIHGSREFLSEFLRTYAYELAIDTPLFGKVYKSFIQTSQKFNDEFENINDKTRHQFSVEIQKSVARPKHSHRRDIEQFYSESLSKRFQIDSIRPELPQWNVEATTPQLPDNTDDIKKD